MLSYTRDRTHQGLAQPDTAASLAALRRARRRRAARSGRSSLQVWVGVAALLALGASVALNTPPAEPTPSAPQVASLSMRPMEGLAEMQPGRAASAPDVLLPALDLPGLPLPPLVLPPVGLGQDPGSATIAAEAVLEPSRPLWVRTTAPSPLWSGASGSAVAFTDLPAGTLLRVQGRPDAGRLPIFYFGDGLLRRPGAAWVEERLVRATDAPAPGEEPQVDAAANRALPTWVQAHRATSLWSGPDDRAVTLTSLPQWSYLKVAGTTRGGRVLVEYAGDYATRQPGVGWVDEGAIGPAGEPGIWLQSFRVSSLFSGPDDRAARFTDLPQWSKVRIVDGAPNNPVRVLVEFYGDGRTRQPGVAWVPRADVGPITPPTPLPAKLQAPTAATTAGAPRAIEGRTFASQQDFINTVGLAAQKNQPTSGVPASVTVAQAILESDWGRSRLTRQGNNLFGIKAQAGSGSAGAITLSTWEVVGGKDIIVQAAFKAYYTIDESIDDHGRFFRGRNYREAMQVANDPRAFARAIQAAGYATDPEYADKLIRLMDRYNLYRFDAR